MSGIRANREDIVENLDRVAVGTEKKLAVEGALDGGTRLHNLVELAVDGSNIPRKTLANLEGNDVKAPNFGAVKVVLGLGELRPDGGDFFGTNCKTGLNLG